jgi:hypothetical protein
MRTAFALVGIAVSLALAVSGCGGDDSSASATEEWAEGFCTAITDWTAAITESTDELRNLSSLSPESFEEAAGNLRTATSDFADDLRALGAPETESGEEAKQAIDEFSAALEDDSAEIESAIQDVSGITDVPAAVQAITAALTSMNEAFTSMISTIREGDAAEELETALEDADACADLG